jgi:hypothetical protein
MRGVVRHACESSCREFPVRYPIAAMRTRWAVGWRFWNSCSGELPFAFPNRAGGKGRANKTPLPLWGSEAGYTPLLKVPRANATRKDDIYNCPPPLGSPRFARGTALCARSVPSACREHREACHSVPPASRGNLKEGVIKIAHILLAPVIAMALFACQPNNANTSSTATNPTSPPPPKRPQSLTSPPSATKSSTPTRTTHKRLRRGWSSTTATSMRAQG